MPGAGKTTLGLPLAKSLNLPFFDLDAIIEAKEGKAIKDIFTDQGEAYFREVEARALRDFCMVHQAFILATGGGTACFHKGVQFMNEQGTTVFINVSAAELFKRLHGKGTQDRPLLNGKTSEQLERELEGKVMKRLPYYNKATISIAGDRIVPQAIIEKLA
ncbi:shikimate kinase [Persicobacter psychrovividus]|uniref:Shikimate kinase n=2 Tax=Persicobacter psychrovividus TaxID=387638 RepID=A0ABM7VGX1_9BACT|nr:shikimate kinase [Persicobacter psychrovividus]